MHRHQQNSNDADEQRQPLVVSNQSIHRASYGAIDDDIGDSAMPSGSFEHNNRAKRLPQFLATITATSGALAAGCVLAWSSPMYQKIVDDHAYDFNVTAEQFSWVGSNSNVGGIISCLIIGFVMDRIGRKITLLALVIPFTIGWAFIIWATSVAMLYIGRFLTGFAGGAFFVVAPAYIGEIASKDIRGTLGSCLQLMITIGILFVYVIGHFNTVNAVNIICAVLPLIFFVLFVWMPETPYYCIMQNRIENAENALKRLRGDQYDYNNELTEMQIEHEMMKQRPHSWLSIFRRGASRRALFITVVLVTLTQLSGINAVIFYTGFIFGSSKTGIESSMATIIVGIMQVLATFVASLTVDRLGRRCLLITSAVVMALCNLSLGGYFYLLDHSDGSLAQQLNWIPIASLCIYIIAFSLGLGPIPWVLVGELFTTESKAISSSLSGATSWAISFVVTKLFPTISQSIGVGETFFIFAAFAVLCTIFVWCTIPETKGKSFNDIQRSLGAGYENDTNEHDDNTTVTSVSQNTIDA